MHERRKLAEARYFLARMYAERDSHTTFCFELSAFLGAARSVLQYALREAKPKLGGKPWYGRAMARDPLLAFFKDQRDANIHTTPVSTAKVMTTRTSGYLRIEEDTIIPHRHETGELHHRFADWPGDEEVTELAERYLKSLQALVDDGVLQGMISD